jgi:hypothetical protein
MNRNAGRPLRSAVRPRCSEICRHQIVRTPAAANIDPGCGGTYQVTVAIECVQKTRLIGMGVWLNTPQRIFLYEKGCLDGAVVSPKSYRAPRWVI